jgi:hypothetical protein
MCLCVVLCRSGFLQCPICNVVYGVRIGTMPEGTMNVSTSGPVPPLLPPSLRVCVVCRVCRVFVETDTTSKPRLWAAEPERIRGLRHNPNRLLLQQVRTARTHAHHRICDLIPSLPC